MNRRAVKPPAPKKPKQRGGKRAGAGRPSTYDPAIALQMLEYSCTTFAPSLKHFSKISGIEPYKIRRWRLRHRDFMNAVGTLEYRRDCDLGRAA